MPRLGEDPNVATAYPNRVNTNLRGSWLRQIINTFLGTLLMVFLFNKLIKTDYKVRCLLSALNELNHLFVRAVVVSFFDY